MSRFLASVILLSCPLLPAVAPALAAQAADPPAFAAVADKVEGDRYWDWERLTTDGFGRHGNDYAWSSTVYRDHLFIGTLNLLTGGQIWCSNDGQIWEQVEDNGFGSVLNEGIRVLIPYRGWLHAGTNNPTTGPQVWRTRNGRDWERTNFPDLFGNISMRGATIFQGDLYLSTWNQLFGAQIWRSQDGMEYARVARNGLGRITNQDFSVLQVFAGDDGIERLYAGTLNPIRGAELYRSEDGENYELVVDRGFGDLFNQAIWSSIVHQGWLWVGTMNAFFEYEIHRSRDGLSWEKVPPPYPGSFQNHYAWDMGVYADHVYVGSLNLLTGAQLYRYDEDGLSDLVMRGGFGRVTNYGVRVLESFHGHFYAGTANPKDGCEMWRSATANPQKPLRGAEFE